MPQNGFHGLAGLAVARLAAPRLPPAAAGPFVLGVTLGAMLPDADMYPTALAFVAGRADLTEELHRTYTHSLLALLLVLGLAALYRLRQSAERAWLWWGAAVGLVTHLLLDAFFWFGSLDLFWPLRLFLPEASWAQPLDLWQGVEIPEVLKRLREAVEFAAFALYLGTLRSILRRHILRRTAGAPVEAATGDDVIGPRVLSGLGRWAGWSWAGFAVALAGIWLLPPTAHTVFVMACWLVFLAPYCWRQTVRLRGPITAWCRGPNEPRHAQADGVGR